ncbi:Bug family tripartite tricarboxylate transporter substrate binding protein [Xylophilus sp.]|uniref:Bug family tripartite tricarboxylate transporter substrate binding protein n=1 Tax=Xylophilus sp. TaxID=2653893 RepID=UPI0013B61F89|nr:tripartite tricarboxylate transporter substrate binding protein [Xylophilus sp.]KAF1049402.1 MAG: hypothetical protein GAK38_00858 [Xylophilus sp.]
MHRRLVLAAGSALGLFATAVQASDWPAAKPITWVVPFAPGGSTDVVARAVGQKLSVSLKQAVVIDNRPGAGGTIGVQAVARAPADGYTLIGGTISTHAINAALYRKLPYDPVKDFEPVTLIAYVPNVLMVNSALGVNTVQKLVAWIRRNPEKASYASSGAGTSTHLTGAQMAELIKVPMQHIAYKGSPQALQDVAAGNVPFLFDQLTAGLPLVKAGKLKFLAVTTRTRSPLAPDVPTTAEAGFPGLDLVSWQALYAPRGTPKAVIARLNADVVKALRSPGLTSKLETQFGMEVVGSTPAELAAITAADTARLGELVRRSGATAE